MSRIVEMKTHCDCCGGPIAKPRANRNYCSRKCARKEAHKRARAEKVVEMMTCRFCGKSFPAEKGRVTCGAVDCMLLNRRPDRKNPPRQIECSGECETLSRLLYQEFYSHIMTPKIKVLSCLKCHIKFRTSTGHRICNECAVLNSRVGAHAI